MNLYTSRVTEKKYKGRIESQLLKKSQECRALATLRLFFPDKFDSVKLAEAPDLQDMGSNIGAEVTVAVKPNDMKAASAFSEYLQTNNEKRKKTNLKIIEESSSSIITSINGIETMTSGGGLDEKSIYKEALKRKINKSAKYRQVVKQLFLVVYLPEIPSSEAEECIEKWTKEVIKEKEYDGVYVISERFCIQIDLLDNKVTKNRIDKDQSWRLGIIGRMTAEGEIDLTCEEWN